MENFIWGKSQKLTNTGENLLLAPYVTRNIKKNFIFGKKVRD